MWDRLFGRDKDEGREPACAACGRTLLPGEWAQSVVGDSGREEVICSLCAQSGVAGEAAPEAGTEAAAHGPVTVSGRPQPIKPRPQRDSHEDSDAFWRALKEKDTEIARLQDELLAATTQSRELAAQVSLLERQLRGEAITDWHVAAPFADESDGAAEAAAMAIAEPVAPEAAPLESAPAVAPEAAPLDTASAATVEEALETAPGAAAAKAAPGEKMPPAAVAEATQPLAVTPDAEAAAEAAVAAAEAAKAPAESAVVAPVEAAEGAPVAAAPEAAGPAGLGEDDERTAAIPVAAAAPAAENEAAVEGPSWLFDTPPHQTFGDSARAQAAFAAAGAAAQEPESEETTDTWEAEPTGAQAAPAEAVTSEPVAAQQPVPEPVAPEPAAEAWLGPAAEWPAAEESTPSPTEPEEQPEPATPEELEAEARALAVLQRGADLLNVSQAPRKVAETSQSLGIPGVQLSSDEETVSAVFLWSMAWYRFDVDLASGDVALKDRGYEDRADLTPNAKVRADGTVQVLPLPTRRTAARPAGPRQESQAAASPEPQAPLSGKGDFISGSLMGQRTDDEPASWDEMSSRDFDWGR